MYTRNAESQLKLILGVALELRRAKSGVTERGVLHRAVPQKYVRGRASGTTVRSGHVRRVF